MRVDLVVHRFPRAGSALTALGGTERYTLNLAQALRSAGHAVSVITYTSGRGTATTWSYDVYDGLSVQRLALDLGASRDPMLEEYDSPRVYDAYGALLTERRPDLVHVTHAGHLSAATLRAAQERRIPTVMTLTDMWAVCPAGLLVRSDNTLCLGPDDLGACVRCLTSMGPRGRPYRALVQAIPPWALRSGFTVAQRLQGLLPARALTHLAARRDAVRQLLLGTETLISPGRFLVDVLAHNGYPRERLTVLPHGIVEPERLASVAPVRADGGVRFGYLGPLAAFKGAHLPIEAFGAAQLGPGATLTYWGSTESEPGGTAYARSVAARILRRPEAMHRGPYDAQSLPAVLGQIDILIVPSLCYENTPTVVYEALAAGRPVIATDAGGMRELVRDLNGGWLISRGSVTELAALMERLSTHPEEVTRAAAAIRPVPSFTPHAAAVWEIYQHLVAERQRA